VQPAVFGVVAQQQGADMRPAARGIGPADHHTAVAREMLQTIKQILAMFEQDLERLSRSN
jgi:hypothetical protein